MGNTKVFKKSDSNQIEMVMTGIISIILILLPISVMLMWFGYITEGWMTTAEIIITFGGGILLIFAIMYLIKPENRYLCLLDVFLLLEALSFVLSTIFANSPDLAMSGSEFSMEGTTINLVYLLLIFCCSTLKNKKHRTCVYIAFILVALFECFMGFMQTVVKYGLLLGDPDMMAANNYRAYGSLMNQNTYGGLMAIFAALEFGLFITARKKWQMVLHALLTVAFSCCVIFSGTRGAMVGLGFAILFYGVIVLVGVCKKSEFVKGMVKRYAIAVLIAVVAVIIAYFLSTDTAQGTIARTTVETDSDSTIASTLDSISSGRIGIWKKVVNEWVDNGNLVTGLGVSNLRLIYYNGGGAAAMVSSAHNVFLEILATRGIVGIITYLALMLYVYIFAMKKIFKNGISNSKELFGLLIAFVAFMASEFFGWRIIYLTPYFYVCVGLMIPRDESKKLKLKKKWKRK